jgi:hypothetical protein
MYIKSQYLPPRCRVFMGKLSVRQLVKKCFGVLSRSQNLTNKLYPVPVRSIPPPHILLHKDAVLILSSNLRVIFLSSLFPSCLWTNILNAIIISPIHTCHGHLMLFSIKITSYRAPQLRQLSLYYFYYTFLRSKYSPEHFFHIKNRHFQREQSAEENMWHPC